MWAFFETNSEVQKLYQSERLKIQALRRYRSNDIAIEGSTYYKSFPLFLLSLVGGAPAMNQPRSSFLQIVCLALLTVVLGFDPALGATSPTAPEVAKGRKLPLKEQLTLGLKARTKEDKEFIDLVVSKVEEGELPRSLVDSTFLWARERANRRSPSRSLRPIVYFRPGLLARAKFLKIPF